MKVRFLWQGKSISQSKPKRTASVGSSPQQGRDLVQDGVALGRKLEGAEDVDR